MPDEELPNPEFLDLGARTIPRAGHLLADLIRGAVGRQLPRASMRAFGITCETDGQDLPAVSADLTDWQVPLPDPGAGEDEAGEPPVTRIGGGTIGRFRMRAAPMVVGECPIFFKFDFRDVPICWYSTYHGTVAIGFDDRETTPARTHGRFLLEVSPPRLAELYATIMNRVVEDPGVAISRARASVSATSDTEFQASGSCRIRYRLLWMRIGIHIGGSLSEAGTLRLESVSLQGSNLLLRLFSEVFFPRAWRSQILGTYDLNDYLPEGHRISRLRFRAGQTLRVSGAILAEGQV